MLLIFLHQAFPIINPSKRLGVKFISITPQVNRNSFADYFTDPTNLIIISRLSQVSIHNDLTPHSSFLSEAQLG